MSQPYFSVLIPAYNGEKFIRMAIDSVLAQTCPDFDLWICDDCSTDGTVAVVQEYAARDHRVKLLRHEVNRGGICNRNTLIDNADGRYVVWLDHDDELKPEFLQTAKDILDKEDWDIVHFPHVKRFADGHDEIAEPWLYTSRRGENMVEMFFSAIPERTSLWGRAIKREVMQKAKAPDIRALCDDFFFSMPLWYHAESYYAPEVPPMYVYYFDNGYWAVTRHSMTLDMFRKMCEFRAQIFYYFKEFLEYHQYKFNNEHLLLLCDVGFTLTQLTFIEDKEERSAALQEYLKYFSITIAIKPYELPFHACDVKKAKRVSYSFKDL